MPRELTLLPVATAPHLSAIGYLAVLAYPDDLRKRDRLVAAGRAWLASLNPRAARSRSGPAMRKRDVDRALDHAARLILDRRRWAAAELNQELLRFPKREPKRGRSLRLAAFYKRAHKAGDRDSAYNRIWKESLPVLHLAYGLVMAAPPPELERPLTTVTDQEKTAAQIRVSNLRKARAMPSRIRLNINLNDHYAAWSGAADVRGLILYPFWVAEAVTEAERTRQWVTQILRIADDADTIALATR